MLTRLPEPFPTGLLHDIRGVAQPPEVTEHKVDCDVRLIAALLRHHMREDCLGQKAAYEQVLDDVTAGTRRAELSIATGRDSVLQTASGKDIPLGHESVHACDRHNRCANRTVLETSPAS